MAEDRPEGVQASMLLEQPKAEDRKIDVLANKKLITKALVEMLNIPLDPNKPMSGYKLIEDQARAKIIERIWGKLPAINEYNLFAKGEGGDPMTGYEFGGEGVGLRSLGLHLDKGVLISKNGLVNSDMATIRGEFVMGDGFATNARKILVENSVVFGDDIFARAGGEIKDSIVASRNIRFRDIQENNPLTLKNVWLVNPNGDATFVQSQKFPIMDAPTK